VGPTGHARFVAATTAAGLAATALALGLAATGRVTALDLALFAACYTVTGLGITVGFHRLLAHRSFTAPRWVEVVLTVAGSAAGQGPAIVWVAHHRRHHRFTDRAGDPHSPRVRRDGAEAGGWAGLWRAHTGWLLDGSLVSDHLRTCPDLLRRRHLRVLSLRFGWLVAAGVVLPGILGALASWSLAGGLTGALWGGPVRLFAGNQVTWSINSLTHRIGRRPFATPDGSGNIALLALLSFGEGWHNNHHASPRSARFAAHRTQLDVGGAVIGLLARLGLAGDVEPFHGHHRARATGPAR
jgi:stearoyl-CoA desaturase (Delta-9 desaturase)